MITLIPNTSWIWLKWLYSLFDNVLFDDLLYLCKLLGICIKNKYFSFELFETLPVLPFGQTFHRSSNELFNYLKVHVLLDGFIYWKRNKWFGLLDPLSEGCISLFFSQLFLLYGFFRAWCLCRFSLSFTFLSIIFQAFLSELRKF